MRVSCVVCRTTVVVTLAHVLSARESELSSVAVDSLIDSTSRPLFVVFVLHSLFPSFCSPSPTLSSFHLILQNVSEAGAVFSLCFCFSNSTSAVADMPDCTVTEAGARAGGRRRKRDVIQSLLASVGQASRASLSRARA